MVQSAYFTMFFILLKPLLYNIKFIFFFILIIIYTLSMNFNYRADQMPILYYSINYIDKLQNNKSSYEELQSKCNQLELQNSELKSQIQALQQVKTKKIQKKKKRRSLEQLKKNFECPYSNCGKQYASDLALNLHMKNKHNGGTKTQRQALAREIVLADEKGERLPEINLNFPPGYLKKFKQIFFATTF